MGVLKKTYKDDTLNIRIHKAKKEKAQAILRLQNRTLTEIIMAKIDEVIQLSNS